MVKTVITDSELEDSKLEDSELEYCELEASELEDEDELVVGEDELEEEELCVGLTAPQDAKTRLAKVRMIVLFFFIDCLLQNEPLKE